MAISYKRKRTTASRSARRKRTRASAVKLARTVNTRNELYHFTRWGATSAINGNAAYLPYSTGFAYNLNQLAGVADFTGLFDRYQITYVKHYFTLSVDVSAQSATTAVYPQLFYVRDYDDNSPLITMDEMRQHGKCRRVTLMPGKTVSIGLRPAILAMMYATAITTSYCPKWNQWVDMATPQVPYYGLKVMIDNLTNTNFSVKHEMKFWIKCKDTR